MCALPVVNGTYQHYDIWTYVGAVACERTVKYRLKLHVVCCAIYVLQRITVTEEELTVCHLVFEYELTNRTNLTHYRQETHQEMR